MRCTRRKYARNNYARTRKRRAAPRQRRSNQPVARAGQLLAQRRPRPEGQQAPHAVGYGMSDLLARRIVASGMWSLARHDTPLRVATRSLDRFHGRDCDSLVPLPPDAKDT